MKRKKKVDSVDAWSHKHDYPIEEVNTDNTIARLIVPRLKAFRALDKHGYPGDVNSEEAWHKIIDKMIYAFELNMPLLGRHRSKRRILKRALRYFASITAIYGIKLWI